MPIGTKTPEATELHQRTTPGLLLRGALHLVGLGHQRRQMLSPDEIQFRIEGVFRKFPLTNEEVLFAMITKAGSLSEDEIARIAVFYEGTYEAARGLVLGHTSVAALASFARIPTLSQDPFLAKVCFDYGREVTRPERLQDVLHELEQEERHSVSCNDPKYLSVERRMTDDLSRLYLHQYVAWTEGFNSLTQTPMALWKPASSLHAENFALLEQTYKELVFPLLQPDQLIKAGHSGYLISGQPRIDHRFL